MSRFSLPLGFDNKSIAELCEQVGINSEVFLLVVNFLISGRIDADRMERVTPMDIVRFLHNSHDYYLHYKFPHIRTNLISALDPAHEDINPIIINYFDKYITQVEEHFKYEEHMLFPYAKALTDGEDCRSYSVDLFTRQHGHEVEERLNELKNIILRYYSTSVPYKMYDALVDIFNCEDDLKSHAQVEDHILVPLIERIESARKQP